MLGHRAFKEPSRNPELKVSFRYLRAFARKDCPIFQEHSPLAGIDTFAGKPRNRGVIAEKDFNHVPRRILMIRKIVLLASAGVLAASVATAQNTPPPGNVNPGSTNSGAEQSGAENQPRSTGGQRGGTTGSGMTAPSPKAGGSTQNGINANVKPSSKESGSEPAGEPAGQRR